MCDNVGDAIVDDGADYILDEKIRYYINDTYISVYGEDGDLVTGRRPRGIDEFPPIDILNIQSEEDANGNEWFTYDSEIELEGKKLYVRGMINGSVIEGRSAYEQTLFIITIPIIILLASISGYFITRRAFAPVREIINTTNEIEKDADFSRRIPLGNSRDEIYELSESINRMFDKIEDVVGREKQFTSDVSHELRTPITVIRSLSEYAMEDSEYVPKALEVINRESRRMTSLISNLLMLARSDAGRLKPNYETLDLSEVVEDIVAMKEKDAEDSGVKMELRAGEILPVSTDRDMATRIMLNLLDNAIKYVTKPGGRVIVDIHRDGDDIVCLVADNGEGIPSEEADKIWQRFYRRDKTRSGEDSTGLGLAMTESLSKALGGSTRLLDEEETARVWNELDPSEESYGAVFEFRLPEA